jgi:hypothetical protein
VENKMKKLAISVLVIAGACCGVHGMEMCETDGIKSSKLGDCTKLFPRQFWLDTEMISQCMTEVKKKVVEEIVERKLRGDPLDYCKLFRGHTWNWICKNFQYDEMKDMGKFLDSVSVQFPGIELPFLNVIKELGLEEKYWTRKGWPPERKRYFCRSVDDD